MPHFTSRKSLYSLLSSCLVSLFLSFSAFGQVTISGGFGADQLCVSTSYTPISPIVLTETSPTDFVIAVASADIYIQPTNAFFEFKPGTGSVSFTGPGGGVDVGVTFTINANLIRVSLSQINPGNNVGINTLTISGLEMRATSAALGETIQRISLGGPDLSINGFAVGDPIASAVLNSYAAPTVFAGADDVSCYGLNYSNFADATSSNGTLLWTSNGTGTLMNATTANPTYTPGPSETGNITFRLTVTGSGNCGSVQDTKVVTILPQVVANAGAARAICNGSSTTLGGSPTATGGNGTYTYSWTGGSTLSNPVVSPASTTTYNLAVTDGQGCIDNTQSVTVTVNAVPAAPVISPAGPINQCQGAGTVTLSTSGGTNYRWYKDGVFTGQTTSSINFAELPANSGSYTVSIVDVIAPTFCESPQSSAVSVIFNPLPSAAPAVVPASTQVCSGGSALITVNGTEAGINYQVFNGGVPVSGIVAGTGGSIGLSTSALLANVTLTVKATQPATGCNVSLAPTVAVTVNPLPTANAGGPVSVCQGSSATLNGSGTGGTSPYSYSWSPVVGLSATNIANPVFSGLNSTTFTLVVTDVKGCVSPGDNATVTVNPKPVANAGPDKNVCFGSSVIVNGSASGGTGPYTYSWSPGADLDDPTSATPIFSGLATVTLTLTVTDANLCTGTDAVAVTVNPLPVADAGANRPLCTGSNTTLGGTPTATGGSSSYTYDWKVGVATVSTASNPVVSPVVTTTYNLTVTDGNGCTATSSVTVTVNPIPAIPTAASPTPICVGGTDPTLTASGAGGAVFNWYSDASLTTNVQTGASYTPTVSGVAGTYQYYVTQTVLGCQSAARVVTVVVNPAVVAAAGSDATLCSGSSVALGGSPTGIGGNGSYTYSWSPTTGLSNSTASNPILTRTVASATTFTYTLTVTDGNLCVGTDQVDITFNPIPAIPTAASPTPICVGGTDPTLTASGAGGAVFNWYSDASLTTNVQTGASYTPTVSGVAGTYQYYVTQTVLGCQSAARVVTVVVNPAVVAAAGSDATLCSGSSVALGGSPTGIGGNGSYTYSWSPTTGLSNSTASNPILTRTVASATTFTYTLTVTDGNLCVGTDQVDITFNPIPAIPTAASPTPICVGGTDPTLTASGAGGAVFNWYSDASLTTNVQTGASYTPTVSGVAGTYQYYVTQTVLGCQSAARVVTVVVNPAVVAAAGSDATLCSGSSVALGGSPTGIGGNGSYTYSWSPTTGLSNSTASNPILTRTVASATTFTYTLTVTDGNLCVGTDQVDITFNPIPAIPTAASPTPICVGGTDPTLTASGAGGAVFNWYSDASLTTNVQTGASYTPTVSGVAGTYQYYVTQTVLGCQSAARVVTVVVNPAVVAAAGSDATLCSGSSVALGGSPTGIGGNGSYTYSWSPTTGLSNSTASNPILTRTVASATTFTYTLTVTDGNFCVGTDQVDITFNPIPVLTPQADIVECPGFAQPAVTFVTNIDPVTSYNWSVTNFAALGLAAGTGTTGNIPAWTFGTNTGLTDIVGMATVTATKLGCTSAPINFEIRLKPMPVGVVATATVCSDAALGSGALLTTTGTSVSASGYNITSIGNPSTLVASAGSPAVASNQPANVLTDDAWTNTGTAPATITYNVVPVSSAGCLGNAFTVTITVNPEPVGVVPANTSVCSDVAIGAGYTLTTTGGSVAATGYNITAINNGGLTASAGSPAVATNQPANVLTNDAWTNTTNAPVNVVYTVVPVSGAGCLGDAFTVTVTINPEPVGTAIVNVPVCSDIAIGAGYTLSTTGGSVAATGYNITAINNGGLTASAGSPAVASNQAANVLIDDAWTNTGSTPVNVVYTVVPVAGTGCLGDAFTVTVTINPEPVGIANTATVCSDAALGSGALLTTTGTSVSASGYNITSIGNPSTLVASAGSPAVASNQPANVLTDDAWTNTGTAPATITYNVVPVSSAGCLGNAFTVTITVNPEPVGVVPANTSVCSDVAIGAGYTLTTTGGSVAATGYNITAINNGGLTASAGSPAVATNQPANVLTNDAWTNTTNAPVNVVYTVVPVSGAGCLGDAFTVTVTINPEPVGTAVVNVPVCSDIAIGAGYTLSTTGGSVAATGYNITAINNGGLTASAGSPAVASNQAANVLIDDAWTNTGSTPVNVVYTVVPVAGTGCLGDAFTVTVTINPEPVGIANTATVCSDAALGSGALLTTTGTSVSASGYNITSIGNPSTLVASAGSPAVASNQPANVLTDDAWTNTGTAPATITYNVVPVSSAGCLGNAFTVTITVNPEPVGVVPANTSVCSDVAIGVGYTLSTTGGSVAATGYNITAINNGGLTASAGSPAVATNQPANVLTNDAWTNTTNAPVNVVYTVVPVSGAGCLGDAFTVTVTINPEPVGTAVVNVPVCSDIAIGAGYTLSTTGGSVAATGYNITAINNGGLTASAGSPAVASNQAANVLIDDAWTNTGSTPVNVVYTVVPVAGTGCLGDAFTVTVTINPEPVGIANTATVCSDAVLGSGALLTTTGTSVSASGYNITSIGNPSTLVASAGSPAVASNQPANVLTDDAWTNTGTAPATITYNVVPVSSAGCLGNAFTVTITVNPEPVGVVPANTSVCSDVAIGAGYTLTTTGGSVAATGYNITAINNGGLTASAGSPAVATNQPANVLTNDAWTNTTNAPVNVVYTVVPVSGAGCLGDAFTVTVTINPEPVGTAVVNVPVCSDIAIGAGYTLSTTGGSVAATGYNITAINNGGLTASAGSPAVASNQAANVLIDDAWTNTGSTPVNVVYTVVPVAGTGCLGDAFTVTVTINPEPVGIANTATVCSDAALGSGALLTTTGTSVSASGYNITSIGNPSTLVASAGSPAVASNQPANVLTDDAWTNTGTAPATITYNVVPVSSAGCLGNAFTVTITVNPEPVGVVPANTSVCSDVAIGAGYTLTTTGGSVAATGYNITAINNGGLTASAGSPAVATNQPANVLTNDAWTNTTNAPVNVVYTVVPVSGAGCLGDAFTVTVTINPEPVGTAVVNVPVCSDIAIGAGYTLSTTGGSVAATGYNITAINNGGLTASAGSPAVASNQAANVLIDDAWTNTGSTPVNVVYTVVPVAGTGCLGDAFTVTVTINPEPVGIANTATVCSDAALGSGALLTTTGTSVSASGYNITSIGNPSTLVASAGSPAVASNQPANVLTDDAWTNTGTAPATITYNVVPVSSAGCLGNAFTVTITVNPEPVGVVPANTSVCSDVAIGVGYTLSTTGGSVAATGYNITAINNGGLTASAGSPAVATNQPANVLTNDAWTNTTNAPVNVVYTVVPVSGAGCLGDAFTVTVTINPEPVGTAVVNVPVCSDIAIGAGYTLSTTGGSVAATGYNITAINNGGLTASAGSPAVASNQAANVLIDDAWTNTGSTPVNVVYTVVPVAGTGCLGDAFTVTVTINPEPVGIANTATVCSDAVLGSGALLTTTGTSVSASGYNITSIGNPSTLVASAGSPAVASNQPANVLTDDAWTNTGTAPATITYNVVPVSSAGCLGNAFTVTITVNPEPVGVVPANTSVCSDVAIGAGYTLTTTGGSVAATGYNITAINNGGLTATAGSPAVATNQPANVLTNDAWTNTTNAPVNVVYTVVPVSGAGCLGDAFTVTVTINPEPVGTAVVNVPVCSDIAIGAGYTLSTTGGSVAATGYNITAINNGGLTASAGSPAVASNQAANVLIDDAWTNTGSTPVNVVYTVVPVAGTGCLGDAFTVTVTINPEPVGIANTATVCSDAVLGSGALLTTTGTSVSASGYNITSIGNPSTLVASAGSPAVASNQPANVLTDDAWTNTGAVNATITYTVVPVSSAGCLGDPFTVTITVNPEPVGVAPVNTPVCSDVALGAGFLLSTNGTSAPAASGYNITNIATGGLIASAGSPAVGNNQPANVLTNDAWTNTTNAPVNVVYTVVPVSGIGCLGDALTVTVTIQPEPKGWNDSRTVCSSGVIPLGYDLQTMNVDISGSGNGLASNFQWIAVDNPNVSGESTSTQSTSTINNTLVNITSIDQTVVYTVTPTAIATGCQGDTFTVTVIVKPGPVGLDQTIATCSDVAANYNLINNVAILGNNVGSTFNWIAASNPSVSGESTSPVVGPIITDVLNNITNSHQSVVYTVTPTGTNGCVGSTFQITITVKPEPVGVTAAAPTICSDNSVNYDLQANVNSLGNVLPATFSWIASPQPNITGESINAQNSTVITDVLVNTTTTNQLVTYTVTPTGTNGCLGDVFTITVMVNAKAQINAGPDLGICDNGGTNIALQGLVVYPDPIAIPSTWSGGAGSYSDTHTATPTYTYGAADISASAVPVILTLTSGDPDGGGPCTTVSDDMKLFVYQRPTVTFTGLPPGAPPQMAENQAPIVLSGFKLGGVFTISSPPTSVIGPTYPFAGHDDVNFDPSIVTLGPNFIRYTYTENHNNTATPISCTNFDEQQVIINPVTVIDFAVQGATVNTSNEFEICSQTGMLQLIGFPAPDQGLPPETQFTASTGFFNAANVMIIDKIGVDYFIRTTGLPSDTYTVTYTFKNLLGAITFKSRSVKVFASPIASISVANSCIASAINFTDNSTVQPTPFPTTITNWKWDFADGSFSNLQNPNHFYALASVYNIALDVTTSQGCRATTTQSIRVGDVPTVDFSWSAICNNDSTKFSDLTNPGSVSVIQTYTWNFGDGDVLVGPANGTIPPGANGGRTSGTYKKPDHKYVAFGTFNSKLIVDTNDGCTNSLTQKVFILPYSTVTPIGTNAYREGFETTDGGWIAEAKSPSDTSWIWKAPSGANINTAAAGTKVWWTGRNSNTYYPNEQSVVNGPCFDLRQLKRPMVGLDYWSDSEANIDGAVLQYSVDGGVSWRIIGPAEGVTNRDQGINWFNGQGIPSNPGMQPLGNYGWTDKSGGWKNGRFNLDMIPVTERDQVRLRIAFASNGTNPPSVNYDGFAFDNVFVGEKTRNVLVEHFTNSTAPPSVAGDTWINDLYDQAITAHGVSDFYGIQYHVNIPNPDQLNLDNPADPAARAIYFGVAQPPATIMDGILNNKFKGLYTDLDKNGIEIDRRALVDPLFDLQLQELTSTGPTKISVKLTATAQKAFNSPLIIQIALIEKQVGTFRNVLRKQLLGSDGETITLAFAQGNVLTKQYDNVDINVPIINPGQLQLVAYIQDKNTKEIYQSVVIPAGSHQGAVTVGLEEQVIPTTLNGISIYPNPANGYVYLGLPDDRTAEGFTWKLEDERGVVVRAGDFDDLVNNTKQIDVHGLANGIYIIMLSGPGKSVVHRKIVVMNRN